MTQTIELVRTKANDRRIYNDTHKDFRSSIDLVVMFGGQLVSIRELSDKEYGSRLLLSHQQEAKESIKEQLATVLVEHEKMELQDAKAYIDREMNQWLDDSKSVILHFEAFGSTIEESTVEAIKGLSPYPNDIDMITPC